MTAGDAPSLLTNLSEQRVLLYIAASPRTVAGFQRFIRWTHVQRRKGTHICYGVVPVGGASAVGVLQIWPLEPDYSVAEWGFAIGHAHWGTGLFVHAARLFLGFAFHTLGVLRLEARAVDENGRGCGALCKLGAKPEGILRSSFQANGKRGNHIMWSLLAEEWRSQAAVGRLDEVARPSDKRKSGVTWRHTNPHGATR